MDEMTMVRRLGTLLDPPTDELPAGLRARVLGRLEEPVTTASAIVPLERPRAHRAARTGGQARHRGLLVAGLAAAAAVGVLALAPTLSLDGAPPSGSAAAAELLQEAAGQAARQPAWDPRPDQFVYSRFVETARSMAPVDGRSVEYTATVTRENWRSVDGTRPGLARGVQEPGDDPLDPDGGPFQVPLEPCDGTWAACGNIPAVPEGLPTDGDPGAMLAYLRATARSYQPAEGQPEPVADQETFDLAVQLLSGGGLPPQVRSALLGAVAQIPGVAASGTVQDAAGRTGDGVGLTDAAGVRHDLILDARTHDYLGTRTTGPDGVLGATALLESGVVDRVGQRP